jgi:uncharacterized protein YkwD
MGNQTPRTRTGRTRLVTALVAVAALALPTGISLTAAASASSATTVTTVRTAAQQTYETQVIHYVNVQRHLHGLPSVYSAACPEYTSARWAYHLASTDAFYHQSMYKLLDKCHAHYAGETLGRGAISPQTLVTMWMNSPPHRAVLMSAAPRRIGVGSYLDARGEWVTAANFIKF